MSIIETIRTKLQSYPQVRYEHTATSITVAPESPDGFPVTLDVEGSTYVVAFGGWHGHFDSESEALNCFGSGLCDQCRLRVTSRGGTEYRWSVQQLIDGAWCDSSQTGLLFFPFWRRRSERILQNRFVPNS